MFTQSTQVFSLIWFYLSGTLHCVLLVNCLDPPLSLSAQPKPTTPPRSSAPKEPRMLEGFRQCVGFSSSEAQGHLHTLSLWNGPLVAAPGRSQWCLYQPVKRDSPGLHQVPLSQSNSSQSTDGCSFTSAPLLRRGSPGHDAQSPTRFEQAPNAGTHSFVQLQPSECT